jgi:hypothetical protein
LHGRSVRSARFMTIKIDVAPFEKGVGTGRRLRSLDRVGGGFDLRTAKESGDKRQRSDET